MQERLRQRQERLPHRPRQEQARQRRRRVLHLRLVAVWTFLWVMRVTMALTSTTKYRGYFEQ